jgi:hypothetical protein
MGSSELIDAAESPRLARSRTGNCILHMLRPADCVSPAPSAHLSHRGHGCKARSGTGSAAVAAARDCVSALQGRRRLEAGQWAGSTGSGSAMKPRALEDGAGQRASVVSPRLRASRAKGGISAREPQSSRRGRATPSITNGEGAARG